jgi:ATPase subunit of ABC transporter with duplicated ATPase domains
MKYFLILWVSGLFLLFVPDLYSGSIYTWTDENGVKRYSNTAPDKDPKKVKVIKEMPHTKADNEKSRQNAEKLEQVIEELEAKSKAAEIEKEQKIKKIETEEKKTALDTLNKKILLEKERLQNEIRRIEQLSTGYRRAKGKPISNPFSLAMKKSKIKEYQDKIDMLERSPEDYFGTNAP